jgi:hypothetical protein
MGASANFVKVGEPIRMNVQLGDGEQSLPRIVKGTMRNQDGTFMMEVNLTHVGGGLFKNSNIVMPELDEVTVQYSVFEMDGLTTDESFGQDLDTFVRSDLIGGSSGFGLTESEYIVTYRDNSELDL